MPWRRIAAISAVLVASLATVAATALAVVTIIQWERVLPNTAVGHLDVSGATAEQVYGLLERTAAHHHTDPLVLTFEHREFVLYPQDVAWQLDIDATTATVMGRGRRGGISAIVTRFTAYFAPVDVPFVQRWDQALVRQWVETTAAAVDRRAFHGDISVDTSTLNVTVQQPHGSASLDRTATMQMIGEKLQQPGVALEPRALPVTTTPSLVEIEDLVAVGAQFEAAVSGPLLFDVPDGVFTLTAHEVAALLHVDRIPDGDVQRVALGVSARRVREVIDFETQRAFDTDPQNAQVLVNREPAIQFDTQGSATFEPLEVDIAIVPGRDGAQFDAELFAEQVVAMLDRGLRRSPLALDLTAPDLTTELAASTAPTHLLSTFTTYHQAGQTRVHNIQFLADTVDDTVVMPGDQFSINEISGRRTCEKGYLPAGTIVRGVLVDTCGGGTSQFGTTTFNAVFFAGVQLDQWRAHSWYISRYPMGREATLSYPELDVKFTNDTDGLIIVRTSHTPSSITVSLYGRPIATAVRAQLGNPTNPRPPTTQVRWTDELFEGQERVVQSAGSNGFTVRVTRTVHRVDGSTTTEAFDTVYRPQHRVVERGTKPRPE